TNCPCQWLLSVSLMNRIFMGTCTGPCGGRDCSGGCQCFPEKGARVTSLLAFQSEIPNKAMVAHGAF
uniref:Metallothionein n=1 Tax=Mastacembelus armatus TaxID=205130 RepID=A0A7N8XN84_9TELE